MRRFVAACSVVLIAIALLGACGGSEEEGPRSSDANNNSSVDDYTKLLGDSAKARFKITYTGDDGEEHTYAQDGKGNRVYDSGDTQYFTSADGSVSCNTDTDGHPTCTQLPGTAAAIPFLGLLSRGKAAIATLGGRFGDTSSKTIAGRDAKCLTVSVGASATYCIDSETGVLLEISARSASGKDLVSLKVTKYEEPSDSDFTPPAPPDTVPDISYPSGYTGPTIPGPD